MNLLDSAILGIVEGLTEFIPVSSTAHLIIVRNLLGIEGVGSLAFDAVLQLATILAVILYFRKDISILIHNAVRWVLRKPVEKHEVTMLKALILGTIPAVVIGLLAERVIETSLRGILVVILALIAGSILMYYAERAEVMLEEGHAPHGLTPKKGFWIGVFQALALIPGFSRSGATISGGLFLGLSRVNAVRFSFLLSLPIIIGSGLKKGIDLMQGTQLLGIGPELLVGSVIAFIVGLASIHFLIKYVQGHTLKLFIWYRVVLALILVAVFF